MDPRILDSPIEDLETWKNSIADYDSDEGERPFDSTGILKVSKAICINKNESTIDNFLDLHDRHDANIDLQGLYEQFPRPTVDYDWIDICLADILGIDPYQDIPPMPPELEVFQHRTRKSVLFRKEPPTTFDLEAGPLITKEPESSKRSVVFDVESIPLKPQQSASDPKEASDRERDQSGEKHQVPPQPTFDDDPPPQANIVYKNPSSAVKSRERDWERLRKYFAWLPKLVIQKTFDCTTQLARIPMSAHLQRHYRSPFPALNVNRCNEDVATNTVYADTADIEHGYKAAQFFAGTTSLVCDIYRVKIDAQFLQT